MREKRKHCLVLYFAINHLKIHIGKHSSRPRSHVTAIGLEVAVIEKDCLTEPSVYASEPRVLRSNPGREGNFTILSESFLKSLFYYITLPWSLFTCSMSSACKYGVFALVSANG